MIAWDESGSGPPIVLVHGITEDRRAWDTVLPLLADRFRCVRLDLRGHGESSDHDDYSAIAMTEDVAEVIEAAGLDEPPVLVGHSLGAIPATVYATRAPVRAVLNIDQSLRLGDFAALLAPLAGPLRGPGFHETLQAIVEALGIGAKSERDRDYLAECHRHARRDVVLGVWDQVLDASPEEFTTLAESLLAGVTVPYLAIHGSDPGTGYEQWLRQVMPSATFEHWPGLGHYPHLMEPERFARRVRELVAATAERPA